MGTVFLACLEGTLLLQTFWSSGHHNPYAPYSTIVLESWV